MLIRKAVRIGRMALNRIIPSLLCCRNLFYNKKHTDAEVLGRLVEYVRKNVHHLENYSSEHLLFQSGKIIWLPFKQDRGQQEIEKSNEHGATH